MLNITWYESMLAFGRSVKVALLESHQYIITYFSQKPLSQLNSNFIQRLLRMRERKFVKMGFGHMTKMVATPIYYGKTPLKIFYSRTRWPCDLECSIGDIEPTKFFSNDDPRLNSTYLT